MRRQRTPIISITLALAAVLSGCASKPISFDSERWKSEQCCRHLMVADLQQNHALEGTAKNEVLELLGSPDSEKTDMIVYKVPNRDAQAVYEVFFSKDEKVAKTVFEPQGSTFYQ